MGEQGFYIQQRVGFLSWLVFKLFVPAKVWSRWQCVCLSLGACVLPSEFFLLNSSLLCPVLAKGQDCRAACPWGSTTACISALFPSSLQGPILAGWNLSFVSILAVVSCEKQLGSCLFLWASSLQCPAGILVVWASPRQGQLEFGSCSLPPQL